MRDLAVLFLHLLATVARLAGPGGARSVVAESVLVKHQLLILNRAVEGGRAEQGPRTGVMLTRDGPNVSYRLAQPDIPLAPLSAGRCSGTSFGPLASQRHDDVSQCPDGFADEPERVC